MYSKPRPWHRYVTYAVITMLIFQICLGFFPSTALSKFRQTYLISILTSLGMVHLALTLTLLRSFTNPLRQAEELLSAQIATRHRDISKDFDEDTLRRTQQFRNWIAMEPISCPEKSLRECQYAAEVLDKLIAQRTPNLSGYLTTREAGRLKFALTGEDGADYIVQEGNEIRFISNTILVGRMLFESRLNHQYQGWVENPHRKASSPIVRQCLVGADTQPGDTAYELTLASRFVGEVWGASIDERAEERRKERMDSIGAAGLNQPVGSLAYYYYHLLWQLSSTRSDWHPSYHLRLTDHRRVTSQGWSLMNFSLVEPAAEQDIRRPEDMPSSVSWWSVTDLSATFKDTNPWYGKVT